MMDTMLIQVTNLNALKLLHELEELHLIKVLKNNVLPQRKLSQKYAGKLSGDIADKLQKYVAESRKEWDDRDI